MLPLGHLPFANLTSVGIESAFNASGEARVFIRSGQGKFGLGSVSATMFSHNYNTGLVSSAGVVETGAATVTEVANLTSTKWDESSFETTRTIGPIDVAEAASGKVNAGSFNGFVAVYAKGYKGATLSWKIAGEWFKTTVTSDYQVFQRKTIDVGATVNVDLYINGQKLLSKQVMTR